MGVPKNREEVKAAFEQHIAEGPSLFVRTNYPGGPIVGYAAEYSGNIDFNARKLFALAKALGTLDIDFGVDIGGCPTCGTWEDMTFEVRWPDGEEAQAREREMVEQISV